jgi:ankyrin repeat protein
LQKVINMLIKNHGITSWNELITVLKINENHLKEGDLEKLEEWCHKHIKSNFSAKNIEVVKKIVKTYLKLNSSAEPTTVVDDKIGLSVIQEAAKLDFDSFLQELLALYANDEVGRKAILNSKTKVGNTALHYAALYANKNSLNVLVEEGANPNLANNANKLPISFAASLLYKGPQEAKECTQLLLRETEKNCLAGVDNTGTPLLFSLLQFDDVALFKELLRQNLALLTVRDSRNQNLLHSAIIDNKEQLVKFFLEYEQLVGQKTLNNSTVLHLASRYGNETIIRYLFNYPQCRADGWLNTSDEHGNTPLHYLRERSKDAIIAEVFEDLANQKVRSGL